MGKLVELRSSLGSAADGAGRESASPRTGGRPLVRKPELAELRAFCAAVDLGSIGRAALSLNVTQPALSKRLRQLEALAGAPLLRRSPRGVTMTAAGAQLYRAAGNLLRAADEVEHVLGGLDLRIAPVRLAASATVAERWLARLLVGLERDGAAPAELEVGTATSARVWEMVASGEVDLGLAALDRGSALAAGVTATPLWEEELVIAVPKRHRWADGQEVEPDDFSRTPVIRHRRPPESNAGGSAMPAGAPLFRAAPWAEISDAAAAVALARAACVPALLPAEVAYEHAGIELLVRRVRGIRLERAFGLLLRGSAAEARPDVRELATRVLALGFGEPAQTGVRRAAAG